MISDVDFTLQTNEQASIIAKKRLEKVSPLEICVECLRATGEPFKSHHTYYTPRHAVRETRHTSGSLQQSCGGETATVDFQSYETFHEGEVGRMGNF